MVVRPGLNEELAATAVAGTQLLGELPGRRYDGVVGFWYGKNPGLDRASDAIRHGTMSGTAPLGGAVALIGDDPGGKSSTLPSGCETMAASLSLPLLAPAGVGDLMRLGLHAVALSCFAGVWTGVKVVADLADGAAVVDLALPARSIRTPTSPARHTLPCCSDLARWRRRSTWPPSAGPGGRVAAATTGLNAIAFEPDRAVTGIAASGTAYAAVPRALEDLGIDEAVRQPPGLRLLRLSMPWPLDRETARRLCRGLRDVVVVEEKTSFIESQLKEALYGQADPPRGAHELNE